VTSWLGTGKSVTFFYSAGSAARIHMHVKLQDVVNTEKL
jgi:hypothetical protein